MKVKAVSLVLVVLVLIHVMVDQSLAVNCCHSDSLDLHSMDTDLQFVERPGINFLKGGTYIAGNGGGSKKKKGKRTC